jgi:hypothetical protein
MAGDFETLISSCETGGGETLTVSRALAGSGTSATSGSGSERRQVCTSSPPLGRPKAPVDGPFPGPLNLGLSDRGRLTRGRNFPLYGCLRNNTSFKEKSRLLMPSTGGSQVRISHRTPSRGHFDRPSCRLVSGPLVTPILGTATTTTSEGGAGRGCFVTCSSMSNPNGFDT